MSSPTHKLDRIRKAKRVSQGARRKREIRHDLRTKLVDVARKLGLPEPGMLDKAKSAAENP